MHDEYIQNMSEDIYNVDKYTDNQLYDILNLNNPTDRELEAKINSMIWKYTNMGNDSGDRLVYFFQDIYDRFFDGEEKNEDDITPDMILRNKDRDESINLNSNDSNANNSNVTNSNANDSTGEGESGNSNVEYTTELEYSKGRLNPLLQQTTKRIVSIDSQYRSDKTSISTDFTFNLSDPLKDVVNLKLYSIQIPLTWYVINSSFGSNFLFIKGTSAGIDNGNHDYKITIPVGNYTAPELIAAVNTSMQELKTDASYSDTDFGATNITYDYPSSKSTFNIDIFKHYNENHYVLEFQQHSTPNSVDRTTTIPAFLGFNRPSYTGYTIYSNLTTLPLTSIGSNDDINVANYLLNSSNNSFQIIHYISDDPALTYSDVSGGTVVYDTITITLDLPLDATYSRNDLVQAVNQQLQNSDQLTHFSRLVRVDETNSETIGFDHSHFEMDIRINRATVKLRENSKLSVVFPADTTIWTGLSSAFVFDRSRYEVNHIFAETKTVENKYVISSSPYIQLRCIKQPFDISQNNYVFNVANSSTTGYTQNEYLAAINNGIRTQNNATKVYNPVGDFRMTNTRAYIDGLSSLFTMQIDLTKSFGLSDYQVDFNGTILESLMNMNVVSGDLGVSTQFTSSFPVQGAGYLIQAGDKIMEIHPKSTSGVQNASPYVIMVGVYKRYTDINELEDDLNSQLSNFVDVDNFNVLQGTNISLEQVGDNINVTLNINVRKYLTQNDYVLEFFDTNADVTWSISDPGNSWAYFLQVHQKTFVLNNPLYNVENASYSQIGSATPVSGNIITLNSFNNKVYLKPVELANDGDGIFDSGNANTIEISLPTNVGYNRDQLITLINQLFTNTLAPNGLAIANGSLLTTYQKGIHTFVKMCLNVNRTYRASDYRVVFYDPLSFTTFAIGSNIVTNTTWDATLGWILGFRLSTEYFLADYNAQNGTYTRSITGDNVVSVSIYNYFMILLDDFNQNHLNDGVVTTTQKESITKTPSYFVKSDARAHPISGEPFTNTVKKNGQNMTKNEIYAAQETLTAMKTGGTDIISTDGTSSRRTVQYYSSGPFSKNVFALVPLKISGSQNNSIYVEFGGTLQNQQRNYFGPVNIHRMNVRLVNDRGTLVDLNGANWSFSFICEQLYQQKSL